MYYQIKQVEILLKWDIPKCLFLTFLDPGSLLTGAQLRHNDFRIFADRSSRKTERQREDVSNLFNRFMIYKGQTCAFIILKLPDVFATSSF